MYSFFFLFFTFLPDYSNIFGNNPKGKPYVPVLLQQVYHHAFNFLFFFPDSIDSGLSLVLDSHALTSFIDKTLFKNMAALLLVNLVTLAAIIFVVWIFVICALKPGCPVYNWREIGARSHHPRLLRESHAQSFGLCLPALY